MAPRPRAEAKSAFTLVEVLVVIAIIGVVIALVMPGVAMVRAESKSTFCLTNLRQLYAALDVSRQQRKDTFPYASPLPVPAGQTAVVPSLPERLKAIMPMESDTWKCPADESLDTEELGSSYVYIAGAFMSASLMLEPVIFETPGQTISPQADAERVARLITQRYTNGYLRFVPLMADSGDYHANGNRHPRNAVFIDGNARVVRPSDSDVNFGQPG